MDETSGHFRFLEGYPDDVLAVEATGTLSVEDYETVLIPKIEHFIQQQGRVKVLCVLGPSFEGFTLGAAWEDAKLGLRHVGDFARFAIVTDKAWIRTGVRLMAPLLGAEVGLYHLQDMDAAKDWICRNDAPARPVPMADVDYDKLPVEDRPRAGG